MIPRPLLNSVVQKITPTPADRKGEERMVRSLLRQIKSMKGPHLGAILAGSIARDTHLRGDRDLDIFVFYSPSLSREKFQAAGLKLGHALFGKNVHEEAFSEHPYVRGVIDGFKVEVVPTYKVEKAHEKLSAVDRTPFHASYMKKNLSDKQHREVRLLKQFLKGISAYGADVRMQGVPGYLVEILILEYGSFEKALGAISAWKEPTFIDVEKFYANSPAMSIRFPNSLLVVVDPTDPARNVAGALSPNQFARMIAAARSFLKKPREAFFFAHQEKGIPLSKIKSLLQKEELVGVQFAYPSEELEDVVWGQLFRVNGKFVNTLHEHDFTIRRHFEWTNGKDACVLLIDVENPQLQKSMVRMGPPVIDGTACARFLAAHQKPLSGPRIEKGRLVVIEPRKVHHISQALEIESAHLAETESGALQSALRWRKILNEKGILTLCKNDPSFAKAFGSFLQGKEWFL
ncbi:MAG: CCA tRNA nucleotidyltransferase [archaeon]